jgi:pimeloyl-ACP methyl ester carboxylesterase
MNSIFYKLLDNTMAEVCRREPTYTSLFPITIPDEGAVSAYAQQCVCDKLPRETVESALNEGLAYLTKGWAKASQPDALEDPMVHFLCDGVVDALCADHGLLALQPQNGFNPSIDEVIAQEYSKRATAGGMSYYIRHKGTHPLLLINATGTQIHIWKHFLADPGHDFKIILPRRRNTDLFGGGLQQHLDLETESADLASILDAESLDKVDVLAWCNGARVGIDLANRCAHQISSMVLLGPMLKGVRGISPRPSNFEKDLQPLLDAVSKESSLAPFLAKTISKQPQSPDWGRWTKAPAARAQALFAMPARDHANGMIANLTDPQSFINIARRVASDESYPMDQALRSLKTRTMVIQGSDDNIVSNELVVSAMKELCETSVLKVVVKGSGHYIHDLQYHYFRWLLNEFLINNQLPQRTARISVEMMGRFSSQQVAAAQARI